MALARLSMKVGKPGKAGPHSAYVSRTGEYARYLERGEKLEATEAGNMPAWADANPQHFWQAADANERKNGSTYREMELALPRELNAEQRADLVREWVAQEVGERHAYQWAIHAPKAADGKDQPHAHLMYSERTQDGIARDPEQYFKRYNGKNPERGGCKKGNTGKDKATRVAELKAQRGRWQDMTNRHLERAGRNERIDMRSYADQGRDDAPERKQLPSQWRGQGKADVIEFRQAKAEQRAANDDVAREIPDTRAAVVDLQAKREQRDKRAEAIAKLDSMSPRDVLRVWERTRDNYADRYRQRTARVTERLRGQMDAKEETRRAALAEHAAQRPKEPRGLFALFRRGRYERDMQAWTEKSRALDQMGQERQKILHSRIQRVERYQHGIPDRAARDLAADSPELEAAANKARPKVKAEKEAEKIAKRFDTMAKKRHLRAFGYSDHSSGWREMPDNLKDAIEEHNQRTPEQRERHLKKIASAPEQAQKLEQVMDTHERQQSRGRGR